MIEPDHIVGYGRPATEALGSTIAEAQRGSALAPVTVIVSSHFVGLSARRLLAAAESGLGGGLVNVDFATPLELAQRLAGDIVLPTRPLTESVVRAAVRAELRSDPGPFRRVADHEATERALAAMFHELGNVDEAGLESIGELESTAARTAVDFHRRIRKRLAEHHTEHDLVSAVAGRDDLPNRAARLGHVIWYLPAPMSAALARFVDRVLHEASAASVIVGVTGDSDADEPVWRACEAAGVVRSPSDALLEPPRADRIVTVTDADEEVRVVTAEIVQLIDDGVPADRIAIFAPTAEPYLRILRQQLRNAGLLANGPAPRRLADSVAGRTLLAALELPDSRWRRDRVIALVSQGPVRHDGRLVRASDWDAISRRAGVVRGTDDWRAKLEHHRASIERRLASNSVPAPEPRSVDAPEPASAADEANATSLRRELETTGDLLAFVERLHRRLDDIDRMPDWEGKASVAVEMLVELLGPEHRHGMWPEAEQVAFERVVDTLVRARSLDEVDPSPDTSVFRRAVRAELDVMPGRDGRFGHGVAYGPLSSAVGLDLAAVFIVGAAEGLLPRMRRDEAILPEEIRLHSLDQLESRAVSLRHQHRSFLAALAAAPEARRVITMPRGDLRSNRRLLPSRWLLDTASARSGTPVHATDFVDGTVPAAAGVDEVGSFGSGIRSAGRSATLEHRDLGVLADAAAHAVDGRLAVLDHPVSRLVAPGLAVRAARDGAHFTEYDGNLSGSSDTAGLDVAAVGLSPSRLERWASCGLRYFFGYVLGLEDRDDPETVDDISALDRGSLLHRVLERFIGEAIDRGAPGPNQAWTAADRARILELADECCLEYERTGRTGRPIHWRHARADLRETLLRFLDLDDEFRRSRGATPAAVELDFGVRHGDTVPVRLGDGGRIELRGVADRVDLVGDDAVVVTDYKSGSGRRFADIDDDPFGGGTLLQLGVYAEGAVRRFGRSDVQTGYWLIEKPDGPRREYRWTAELRSRFGEIVGSIVEGIEHGVFPAVPGEWDLWRQTHANCAYCPFDDVCERDRGAQSEAKLPAPELRVRDALVPEPADDPG